METNDRITGRHPVSIGHLVMGLVFLCIVGIWALVQTDVADGDDLRWLLPIPWVVAGAVGLAVTAITGQRRYAVRQTGWVGDRHEPAPDPYPVTEEPVDESIVEEPLVEAPVDEKVAVEETAPITARPDETENPESPENPEEKP
jgi:hypothetical protein